MIAHAVSGIPAPPSRGTTPARLREAAVWFPVAACERGRGGLVRFRLVGRDGSEFDGPVFFGENGPLRDLLRSGGMASPEAVRELALARGPATPGGRVTGVR